LLRAGTEQTKKGTKKNYKNDTEDEEMKPSNDRGEIGQETEEDDIKKHLKEKEAYGRIARQ
jgi:hypothetical protein